jgi:hypothetical protein
VLLGGGRRVPGEDELGHQVGEVEPGSSGGGVRPVDEDRAVRGDQHVVGAEVPVYQGVSGDAGQPAGLRLRQLP